VDEIKSILVLARSKGHKVRCVGCGHSPGTIVDGSPVTPPGRSAPVPVHLLALAISYNRILNIDRASKQVTVESGISLEALNQALDREGLALSSLGSISDQTLGGALACGTHGSSSGAHAVLSAFVVQLHLIDASGKQWVCSARENVDLFNAARVSLGCLGVITRVVLQCESAYDLLEKSVSITFDQLTDPMLFRRMVLEDPEADFVRFHWYPHTDVVVYTRMQKIYGATDRRDSFLLDRKARTSRLEERKQALELWKNKMIGFHMLQALYYASTFGKGPQNFLVPRIARLYSRLVCPPLATFPPSSSTSSAATALPQPIPTFVRQDRHDLILNFDCLFAQYVTEWAIDQEETCRALKEIKQYIERSGMNVHFPIEVRFSGGASPRNPGVAAPSSPPATQPAVQGDGIWLSPAHSRAQAWIGIIMYRPYGKSVPFEEYFKGVELILNDSSSSSFASPSSSGRFHGKPHWAKNVVMPLSQIEFGRLYPKWGEFKRIRQQVDPEGMFSNGLIHQLFDCDANRAVASSTNRQDKAAALLEEAQRFIDGTASATRPLTPLPPSSHPVAPTQVQLPSQL
jgi:L-gulonolactone oxidase